MSIEGLFGVLHENTNKNTKKNSKKSRVDEGRSFAARSYGGAYDIADDQYFTRDDINEFAYNVIDRMDELLKKYRDTFELVDVYFEDNDMLEITIESMKLECTVETSVKVNMRRISRPSDINKYIDTVAEELVEQYETYYDQYFATEVYESKSPIIRKTKRVTEADEEDKVERPKKLKKKSDKKDKKDIIGKGSEDSDFKELSPDFYDDDDSDSEKGEPDFYDNEDEDPERGFTLANTRDEATDMNGNEFYISDIGLLRKQSFETCDVPGIDVEYWLEDPASGETPCVMTVDENNELNEKGQTIDKVMGVRPVLIGSFPSESFELGGYEFVRISDDLAIMNGILGSIDFDNTDKMYGVSNINKFLHDWLYKNIDEIDDDSSLVDDSKEDTSGDEDFDEGEDFDEDDFDFDGNGEEEEDEEFDFDGNKVEK